MPVNQYRKSLLYKISGNGLPKASYLLGTMHMICAKDFQVPPKVADAIGKCKTFYMEVDLGSVDEVSTMKQQKPMETDLSIGLTEKQSTALNQKLKSHFELSLNDTQNIPPIALINKMTIDAMGCEEIIVAEAELLRIAKRMGAKTSGLETAGEQIAIAKKVFTGREMLWQLSAAEDYKYTFSRMVAAYQSENLKHLAALVTNPSMMSKYAYRTLVINRNKRWAKKIPTLIKKEPSFIAVGAGHLPGEQGLLSLLKEKGFRVSAVYK